MLVLSFTVPAVLLTLSQVSAQETQTCTGIIDGVFKCMDQQIQFMPDHATMKVRMDSCFTGCSGTPETFHHQMKGTMPPPPTPEQHECIQKTMDPVMESCQAQLGIHYNFPKPPPGPPPPPPPHHGPPPGFGPPPPHHGHGPPPGPPKPEFLFPLINEICPAQLAEGVKDCVVQTHNEIHPPNEDFHTKMHQCMAILQKYPTCMQQLQQDKQQMCSCAREQARQTEIMQGLQNCAAMSPNSHFAVMFNIMKQIPPPAFGPVCMPAPPGMHMGHGPPQPVVSGFPSSQQTINGPPNAQFGTPRQQFGQQAVGNQWRGNPWNQRLHRQQRQWFSRRF